LAAGMVLRRRDEPEPARKSRHHEDPTQRGGEGVL
jgi:hypothetical protein